MKHTFISIAVAALCATGHGRLSGAAGTPPTVQEARQFIEDAEARLLALSVDASRADWVQSTYITDDTEILAAKADERGINAAVELAKKSTRFDGLRLSLTLATPAEPKESEELTRIAASMESTYGKGKYCPPGKSACLDLEDL